MQAHIKLIGGRLRNPNSKHLKEFQSGQLIRDEQWSKLAKKSGSGAGKNKTPVGTNGTVTQAKPSVATQRKLELNGVATTTPWANLFVTNRLAEREKEQNNDIGQDTEKMQEEIEHQQGDEVQE
ncbi:hypothetical protein RDI58_022142 [Solanum bulbocastanum]|uniref:Uncharacterized protein n=1 Tax=Solanum bulbocastanum TaxID=147425 RepID=A0AAN8T1I5_SOLBU